MGNTFQVNSLPIGDIFNDAFLFRMPRYQRPYAWTINETDELLMDLLTAQESEQPYFLGSVVLVRVSPGSKEHEVIDGQQRLTTLTLLLCVLRELSENEKMKVSLEVFVWQQANLARGTEEVFRVHLRERDSDFFQERIQKPGRLREFLDAGKDTRWTESQQRMFENADHLWKALHNDILDDDQRNKLAQFVIQKCYLVVISASDTSAAHRIFRVLNTRGLELLPTDVLKAYVIGPMLNEIDQGVYNDKWERIEEGLGRDEFTKLFAHMYVIRNKKRHHSELADAFKEDVWENESTIDGKSFIDDDLENYAEAYRVVTNAEYDGASSDRVNMYLKYLNWLDEEDWVAPVMAFYKQNGYDSGEFSRFLKGFERLAYGLLLLGTRRDPRVSRYVKVIEAIDAGEIVNEDNDALRISPQEKNEILNALDGKIYNPSLNRRYGQPLLLRLNSAITEGTTPPEYIKNTIEHVLPQNPNEDSEWIELFPDEEKREQWTHKLANLVLLSRGKNTRAKNYSFARKKKEYFQNPKTGVPSSSLALQIISESEWTREVLERRQKELIDKLKEEWRLG